MIATSPWSLHSDEHGALPFLTRPLRRGAGTRRGLSIRVLLDIPYRKNAGDHNRLDLFLPRKRHFPVVVFAHGGAWTTGDKAEHGHLGTFLARHGIGAVLLNYRLAPQVCHPVPTQDMARAFAWTYRHIHAFGGDPDRLYLSGHSAGGHSAALLGTDESFLAAEGLDFSHVRGVIPISGLYKIHLNVTVARLGFVFRNSSRALASPHWNIKAGCPPFLVLLAQSEIWTLSHQAHRFHNRLLQHGCRSRLEVARGVTHYDIMHNVSAPSAGHGEAILKFVQQG